SEALQRYPEFRPHLVFLDVKMQGMDGLETLRKLRELDPHAQVVMISGHGTIHTAVEATQLGAYDFLEKPLDTDRILLTLRNALQHLDLASENVRLKAEVHAQYEIVGTSRAGKFELADGGTLFLDEIGDMSLSGQAKVLRALEEGVISRVGSGKTMEVDVRVVAATNKDLQAEIAAGRFREDLLYRLNVVPI